MASPVLERVPGQEHAISFLVQAARRPHHAYVLAGPEGSGKSLAARAFAATLLLFALAVALYGAFALLERRVVDWTPRTISGGP
jgi:DNA polymerase III delta prime subunit